MMGWKEVSAAEIAESVAIGPFGSRMKADCYVERGIPIIRGNNITETKALSGEFVFVSEEMAKKMPGCNVFDGDLVFPHRGSIGEVGIVTGGRGAHFFISSSLMKLTPNREIADPLFYFYFYRSPAGRHELLKNASQVGTPGIATPLTSLRSTRVPLPSLAEQRAIASVLSALDDKIELNRRMDETLEELARSIFKSWFVDAARDGLPKGWRESALDKLCEIGRGASPRPIHEFMGGEIPWVKIADATAAAGPFIYRTREFVTRPGSMRSVWVHPGDLILSNSATCGVPAFVDLKGCIHDGWLHFKNLRHISKHYLYHVLRNISEHLIHIADGSVQKNLNTALVGGQRVVVPDAATLERFDCIVVPLFERILGNGRESRTLAELRDALLPKLLSGELRVKNIN